MFLTFVVVKNVQGTVIALTYQKALHPRLTKIEHLLDPLLILFNELTVKEGCGTCRSTHPYVYPLDQWFSTKMKTCCTRYYKCLGE